RGRLVRARHDRGSRDLREAAAVRNSRRARVRQRHADPPRRRAHRREAGAGGAAGGSLIRCTMKAMKRKKVSRLRGDTVLAHREGTVILEPNREWPDGYVESFAG